MPKRKTTVVLLVCLFIGVFILSLASASLTNRFLFTEQLTVNQISPPSGTDHLFEVYNKNNQIGEILFRVESTQGGFSSMMFDEPRTTLNYILDSITLKFTSAPSLTVYMQTDYPTVTTSFNHKYGETTIKLTNMEAYDGGAVPIKFALQTFQNVTVQISADITFHQKATLQLTCLTAHASTEFAIPSN
jgi:hypothetical protein